MTSTTQNLVGNRVYNSSSYAPSRGTNDPSGYVQRELERKVVAQGVSKTGSDGKSDTRSGITQSLLNNQGKGSTASAAATKYAAPAASVTTAQPITTSPASVMTINKTGQLNLPYDFQYAQEALNQKNQLNQGLLGLSQQSQLAAQEYLKNTRNLEQSYAEGKTNTLNNFSSRGVAFSSGYGKAVAKNATSYNNTKGDLDSAFTAQQTNNVASQNQLIQAYNEYLMNAAVGRATQLGQQAGTLNLGKK